MGHQKKYFRQPTIVFEVASPAVFRTKTCPASTQEPAAQVEEHVSEVHRGVLGGRVRVLYDDFGMQKARARGGDVRCSWVVGVLLKSKC